MADMAAVTVHDAHDHAHTHHGNLYVDPDGYLYVTVPDHAAGNRTVAVYAPGSWRYAVTGTADQEVVHFAG